jgi:hypothetical protein
VTAISSIGRRFTSGNGPTGLIDCRHTIILRRTVSESLKVFRNFSRIFSEKARRGRKTGEFTVILVISVRKNRDRL